MFNALVKIPIAAALLSLSALTGAAAFDDKSLAYRVEDKNAPEVFFTQDISPKGLMKVYRALNRVPEGRVAVKLSTGEAGNTHYLQPRLIKDFVQEVNGTIVECNTAYGGSRARTAMHLQLAEDHGFTAIAKVDIMDADGSFELPIPDGRYINANLVGSNMRNYDFMAVLSHFKGHAMGGFGGALKNISIGIASADGKRKIHAADGTHDGFIGAMAEAAKSVCDYFDSGKKMLFISVMNNLSVDCDCDGNPAAPDMHDIGILGSLDPVALDEACVDLIYAAPDGASVIERIESRNGNYILEHAEKIGLGSRHYRLISLD